MKIEKKLMLYAAIQKTITKELLQRIDWKNLIKNKKYNHLFPILYYNIKKLYLCDYIPQEILSILREKYLSNLAKNIIHTKELCQILKEFKKNNIENILLKGMAFISTIYKDVGIREINDIDLLIHKKDKEIACCVLKNLGYKLKEERYSHSIFYNKIIVDLHYEIINYDSPIQKYAFKINTNDLWNNAKKIKINAEEKFYYTKTINDEEQIIYLACHLIKESFSYIKWIADIYKIIEQNNVDWEKLLIKAKNNKKAVYYSLKYINELFPQIVPQYVLKKLKPKSNLIEEKIYSLILKNKEIKNYQRTFLYLPLIEKFTDKIKAIFSSIFYLIKITI